MKWLPAMTVFALLAAQAGAQVIRTETQVVLVDVAVTDKKDNYVQDLEAADFHVWEDGKEQKITSMSRITDAGPDRRQRYTVLLFDGSTMAPREMTWAHQVAASFIDANLAPEHSMAVVGFGGGLKVAQTFTSDAQRLKAAINRQSVSAYSATDAGPNSSATYVVRDELRALDTLVQNLNGVPGRKSLIYFTAGWIMTSDNSNRLDQAIESANRSNVAIYPVNVRTVNFNNNGALTSIDDDVAATPGVGGRLGARPGSSIQLRGAPGPNVGGGVTNASPAVLIGVMTDLAKGTGGFVMRQPDDADTLLRIGQEQKEYYLLGYTPPEGSQGSCHKLRVKVDRKDTEWRARSQYCNVTRGDLLSGNPVEQELEAKASAEGSGNITATMQAPFFYTGPNVARVAVTMQIDASDVRFKKEKGLYQASFDILGVATRPDGATGARFSDTVKLEFDDQKQVDQFKQTPYLYSTQLDAAPGDYTFVVVFSSGEENFGKVEMPLKIEPYQPSDFALSSLALSTSLRAAEAADAALGDLLVDDTKKFISGDIQAIPAGSAVIPPGAQVNFYAEIYEPLLVNPNPELAVGIRMRALRRGPPVQGTDPNAPAPPSGFDSGLLRLDLSANAGKAAIPLLQRVPLDGFAPGPYTLDVQVVDSAGKMAQRTLDFELK